MNIVAEDEGQPKSLVEEMLKRFDLYHIFNYIGRLSL